MQKVKKDAEEYAKANATDTIYIEQIYLYEELKKYVYSDLYFKLKKIHDSYDYKDKNKGSNNSHVGKFDIILSTTGTFVGILGVSALLGCPWGWGVAGAFAFSTIEGWVHYKWKKDSNKKEMIEKYKKDIEENKDQLMNAWRKSFSRGR